MQRAALIRISRNAEENRLLGGEQVQFVFDRSGHHRAFVGEAAAAEMAARPRLYLLGDDAENCFRSTFGAAAPGAFRKWLSAQAKICPKDVSAYCQALARLWDGRENKRGIAVFHRELDGILSECRGAVERQKTVAALKAQTEAGTADEGRQEEAQRRAAAANAEKSRRQTAHSEAVSAAAAARVKVPDYPNAATLFIDASPVFGGEGIEYPALGYLRGDNGEEMRLATHGEWVDPANPPDGAALENLTALTPFERIVAEVRANADPADEKQWRSDDKIKVRVLKEFCGGMHISEQDVDAAWSEFAGKPLTRTNFMEWLGEQKKPKKSARKARAKASRRGRRQEAGGRDCFGDFGNRRLRQRRPLAVGRRHQRESG